MGIDWATTQLAEQMARHHVLPVEALAPLAGRGDVSHLKISLEGLEPYAQSWGVESAIWLALAVLRMLREILDDYRTADEPDLPALACAIPDHFEIVVPGAHAQEIGHRIFTAYNELYAILLRTHRRAGNRLWHRKAVTTYFPQLALEVVKGGEPADHVDEE
jgi:hypothetical protein